MLSRVMASCLALAAFAFAIFAGLAADNPAGLVLLRALMAMVLCYPVGLVIGMICQHVIALHTALDQTGDENQASDQVENKQHDPAQRSEQSAEEVTIV